MGGTRSGNPECIRIFAVYFKLSEYVLYVFYTNTYIGWLGGDDRENANEISENFTPRELALECKS